MGVRQYRVWEKGSKCCCCGVWECRDDQDESGTRNESSAAAHRRIWLRQVAFLLAPGTARLRHRQHRATFQDTTNTRP